MKIPKLIYCGGGNSRFVRIAKSAGYYYGARLPDTIYDDLYFADQNWKKPNRNLYMKYLKTLKPELATVIDIESKKLLVEALDWSEEASQYVNKILFIPKINGIIPDIPEHIFGKETILAYSVPTKYGKTKVSIKEFAGKRVHLLGGSPKAQIDLWEQFNNISDIFSIDMNYFRMKATRYCEYWTPVNKWIADGYQNPKNAVYKCFEKSCVNIMDYWKKLGLDT